MNKYTLIQVSLLEHFDGLAIFSTANSSRQGLFFQGSKKRFAVMNTITLVKM